MNHLENSSINSYNPSWFVISLPEIDIKEIAGEIDFESMTPKELGIYAHEYTHYIQNICTANGLKSSLLSYRYFEQLLIHANKSDYLEIPIKSFPGWESKADLDRMYSICRGSSSDENLDFDSYNLLIEKLKIGSLNETKIVKVEFFKNKIKFKEITFGVLCVKEGMAHYVQKIIDANVQHSTVPYLMVELICKKLFPQILDHPTKIIAICIAALHFQNSGYHFIRLLNNYKVNPDRTSEQFLKDELDVKIVSNNESKSIKEFVIESMNELGERLNQFTKSKTGHFKSLITNLIDAEKNYHSLFLNVMNGNNLSSIEKLRELKAHYGTPTIRCKDGKLLLQGTGKEEDVALEMLELLSHTIFFSRLRGENEGYCGFLSMCSNDKTIEITDMCYTKQWERKTPCAFTSITKAWGLMGRLREKE